MPNVTLKSPYATYRGNTDYPHANGQVVYPVGNRHFARAFTLPTNPDSPMQVIVRANLTAMAQAWQVISDVDAAGWDVLGAAMSPKLDPDGLEYDLTGQMAYTMINTYRLLDAQAQVATAPVYSRPASGGIASVVYDSIVPDLEITFTQLAPQAGFVMLQISQRTYSVRRQARLSEVFLPDLVTEGVVGDVLAAAATITYLTSNWRFAILVGEIRGIRLTWLDVNYVPGQIDFDTIILT